MTECGAVGSIGFVGFGSSFIFISGATVLGLIAFGGSDVESGGFVFLTEYITTLCGFLELTIRTNKNTLLRY